jgi:hypothetical protein
MADDLPRGPDGLQGCGWCGGPLQQPATGRRRLYCKPGHREMAHRARKNDGRVTDALQWDPAAARAWLDTHGVPGPVPAEGEACPYCTAVVPVLVPHLRVCPDGPGFIS